MEAYFDKGLQRWVFPGVDPMAPSEEEQRAARAAALPPPPKLGEQPSPGMGAPVQSSGSGALWEVAAAHVHLHGDVDVRVREVLAGAVEEAGVQQLVQERELRWVLELREAEVEEVDVEEEDRRWWWWWLW